MTLGDSVRRFLGMEPIRVGQLNRAATQPPDARPGHGPPRPSQPIEVEVTPEFEKVRMLINAGAPVIFVSGNAGTGKSTLVRYLREVCDKNMVVVAPTG